MSPAFSFSFVLDEEENLVLKRKKEGIWNRFKAALKRNRRHLVSAAQIIIPSLVGALTFPASAPVVFSVSLLELLKHKLRSPPQYDTIHDVVSNVFSRHSDPLSQVDQVISDIFTRLKQRLEDNADEYLLDGLSNILTQLIGSYLRKKLHLESHEFKEELQSLRELLLDMQSDFQALQASVSSHTEQLTRSTAILLELSTALHSLPSQLEELHHDMQSIRHMVEQLRIQMETNHRHLISLLRQEYPFSPAFTPSFSPQLRRTPMFQGQLDKYLELLFQLAEHRAGSYEGSPNDIPYERERYIPRRDVEARIDAFLRQNRKRFFVLLAHAAMGKSWLLTHVALHSEEIPMFLYHAKNIGNAIINDFQWFLDDTPYLTKTEQLNHIFTKLQQLQGYYSYPFVFILDGMDEVFLPEDWDTLANLVQHLLDHGFHVIVSSRWYPWVHMIASRFTTPLHTQLYGEQLFSAFLDFFSPNDLPLIKEKYRISSLLTIFDELIRLPVLARLLSELRFTQFEEVFSYEGFEKLLERLNIRSTEGLPRLAKNILSSGKGKTEELVISRNELNEISIEVIRAGILIVNHEHITQERYKVHFLTPYFLLLFFAIYLQEASLPSSAFTLDRHETKTLTNAIITYLNARSPRYLLFFIQVLKSFQRAPSSTTQRSSSSSRYSPASTAPVFSSSSPLIRIYTAVLALQEDLQSQIKLQPLQEMLYRGRFSELKMQLEEKIQDYPTNPALLALLSRCYLYLGDRVQGIQACNFLLLLTERTPENQSPVLQELRHQAYLIKGIFFQWIDLHELAFLSLIQAYDLKPTSIQVNIRLALSLRKLYTRFKEQLWQELSKQAEHLKNLLLKYSNLTVEELITTAQELIEQQQETFNSFRCTSSDSPLLKYKKAHLAFYLANIHQLKKEKNRASELYEIAQECFPHFSWAANNQAILHLNTPLGVHYAQLAYQAYPTNINAMINLGVAYYKEALRTSPPDKTELLKALELYNKAIEHDPRVLNAYLNRGACYFHLKQYQKAINDALFILKIDPLNYMALNLKGICEYQLKNYTQALEDLNKALSINPKYKEAYLNRAAVHEAMGNQQLAKQDRVIAQNL